MACRVMIYIVMASIVIVLYRYGLHIVMACIALYRYGLHIVMANIVMACIVGLPTSAPGMVRHLDQSNIPTESASDTPSNIPLNIQSDTPSNTSSNIP